jgi:hypothetical protein
MRRVIGLLFSSVLVLGLVTACDSGGNTDAGESNGDSTQNNNANEGGTSGPCIVGTWEYGEEGDGNRLTFTADGQYTGEIMMMGKMDKYNTASYRVEGDQLILSDMVLKMYDEDPEPEEGEAALTFECSGNDLRIHMDNYLEAYVTVSMPGSYTRK